MRQIIRFTFYSFLGLLAAAIPQTEARGQIQFNEIAVAAGIGSDTYDSAGMHGLGVIWIDYDNDGFPDLFAVNGNGLAPHLFHNEGDGTFSDQDALLPSMPLDNQSGAMFADYDNDGDKDFYITVGSLSPDLPDGGANLLLQNQWVENGNALSTPLFIDVAAAAGVDNLPPAPFGALPGRASYTGAWLDYDRDGCVDLFVGNMDWDQAGTSTNANQLYKNNCNGTFTDVTVSSGVDTGDANDLRPSLAFFGGLLTPGDIDPDLYVVNVHDPSPFHHDLIYRNNGDGTFTEFGETMTGFGDDSGAGMGTAVADIDHDGDWDIYLTDLPDPGGVEPIAEGNPFYLGNPDGTWNENSAPAAGIESNASWGANFADFDQDGFEDLWVGTIAPNNPISSVFRNNGDGTFDDVTATSGFLPEFPGRGTAAADFDRDGDLDIVQINLNDRIVLYENVTNNQGNWLQIELVATQSNRSAIGTLIKATTGGTTRMRQVNGGASAHSQDDLIVHFGLAGAANVDVLEISWPSGEVSVLTDVGVNQMIAVTEPGPAGDLFSDVSAAAGVALTHDGAVMTALGDDRKGTGAAWFDYDNDGDLDLYTTLRTQANRLWQNNGVAFTDVANTAGVQDAAHDGAGVAVADFNNDGCKDLYLANGDEDVLFQNNCDGTFTDVTAGSGLEVSEQQRGTSPSWADYDNDGFLDLYLANHAVVNGNTISGANGQDYLFHNSGDGTFTDVSDMTLGSDREGRSFIGGWTDFDNDGDLDLFKVNDCPTGGTDPTEFFRNDGGTDGATDWSFSEISAAIGANWCQQGMGIAMGDYDRDLDTDLFFTDNGNTSPEGTLKREGAVLLRNDGAAYSDQSDAAMTANTQLSWGGNFFDFDLDGWQDLYMAGGGFNDLQTEMASILWQNNGDGTFADVSAQSGGLDTPERTRTSVFGDYDADGDPDMFIVNYEGPMQLFRNDDPGTNNWVIIDLEGVASNRDGIGAKVEVSTADAVTQYHEVRSGSSLGGGDDIGAYFGLGASGSITNVTVRWPSGTVQNVGSIGINQRHLIVEDGGVGGSSTLAAAPTSVDFGQVAVGASSSPAAIALTNTGTADITVSSVSLGGADAAEFGHDFPGTLVIPAGGAGQVNVTFSPTSVSAPALEGEVLYRVNAGGSAVDDWDIDTQASPSPYVNESALAIVTTAETVALDATVPAGTPMALFQSHRIDASKGAPLMEWDFPVTAGQDITVNLFFAEIVRCQSGGRVFDVEIEGELVLDEYEVFAEVGCEVGTMKSFTVTPADANLDIVFPAGANNRPSILSAIEVIGGGTGAGKSAEFTIVHDGANPALTVDLAGEGIDAGGNLPPTASFSFDPNELSVDFTDASSDPDGSITSWEWDFGDGNASTEQNPSHVYAAAGAYDVSLTVMDDGGLSDGDTREVTVTDGGTGAFLEADGLAVMEAEHFHAMTERSAHAWTESTEHAGFSGAAAMASTPDDGLFLSNDIETTSPELAFDVEIATPGDYHVWVRMWSVDGAGNSVHLGMDGQIDPMSKGVQSPDLGQWVWLKLARGSLALPYTVDAAGLHTVNVWMREDGTLVDKVLITTDDAFVPAGEGPPESPQAAASKSGARGHDQLALQEAAIDLPKDFALTGNYPNPFNPSTAIAFALPEPSRVRLEVYDVMGRKVATLVDADLAAGRYEAPWQARTDAGAPLASGVYLYRLRAGDFVAVKQMILMK